MNAQTNESEVRELSPRLQRYAKFQKVIAIVALVITIATAIIIYPLLQKRNHLVAEVAELEKNRDEMRQNYERERERAEALKASNDKLQQVVEANVPESEKQKAVAKAKNAAYWVGVLGTSEASSDIQTITDHLNEYGYTVKFVASVNRDEPWFAKEPTIFYYSEKTKSVANQLAADLTRKLGKSFKAKFGGGYEVPQDQQKEWLLYIHIQ
jgi:hypothetical protein